MILVTAFEPFGFWRGTVLRRNASLEVMAHLARRDWGMDVRYMRLEVSNEGIGRLRAALADLRPAGLLAMGESGRLPGDHVVLEPFADRDLLVPETDIATPDRLLSSFAARQGMRPEDSGIGAYYCNAAYWFGLRWAAQTGEPPVGFVHVPVAGKREAHAAQVADILTAMVDAAHLGPGTRIV